MDQEFDLKAAIFSDSLRHCARQTENPLLLKVKKFWNIKSLRPSLIKIIQKI